MAFDGCAAAWGGARKKAAVAERSTAGPVAGLRRHHLGGCPDPRCAAEFGTDGVGGGDIEDATALAASALSVAAAIGRARPAQSRRRPAGEL
jgi:hypothetical protein